ncbi:MAG: hypothetical protein NC340_01020 [Ruminococcus flavefaciens]|nr:hypothetical protein [Ruminococcus flavefaciens]MCM1228727.1 hypothetical protein [Ruminococcus flavefaciens]
MNGKFFRYAEYILFAVMFLSAVHGINALIFSNVIAFNAVNFTFAVLFLLSMILISVLSFYKNKTKTVIGAFLGYWTAVILLYNISGILDIDWLENTAEIIIMPFAVYSISYGSSLTAKRQLL